MMRTLALSLIVLGVVSTASAQPPDKAPGSYDSKSERTFGGIVASVISVAGVDGTVGVHLNLKTGTGVSKIESLCAAA